MDIATWLRDLGLERYEPAFRGNDIDLHVLPDLTDPDLERIGVASLGHRKRLLRAAALLRHGQRAPATAGPADTAAGAQSAAASQPERRQLTVLFCDLVGSTALAARLDPEELRSLMRSYQDACAAVVARFEGHVAKYLGDGLLAYFGWPAAHEDEAAQAVRAGLELTGAVARLGATSGVPLAARVGIATGLVVVGDLLGEGAAREEAVVGETPNLAARLQELARADTVVIADDTRRLIGGHFELCDLGVTALRGLTRPVRAWRVDGMGGAALRFEARQGARLTPLVGREREVDLLLDRWCSARNGDGRVVLLTGEPGVGKSRLVEALRERLGDERHTRLLYQCSPQHTGSALHPIIEHLGQAARFHRDDGAGAKLAKLEALLTGAVDDVRAVVPLFAALLAVPVDDRYPPLDLAPQQRKERTLDALLKPLEGVAALGPVLLVFEDLHWADPTSLELLGLLVDRAPALRMLAVLTARPEFAPAWAENARVEPLALRQLGRHEAAALAERVGGKPLPPEVLAPIVERTDGVPLFVEELTRNVVESGLLEDEGDRYVLRRPLPPFAIPPTLRDSLMARLDRMASAKAVAQVAACLGREFQHEMLAAVAGVEEDALAAALGRLAGGALISRHGTPPAATYAFKHALVQEAAYESLLRSKRRELHERIAGAVGERFPEIGQLRPEWLAHHCMEAGLVGPAAGHWLRAARRAKDAYANKEAASHLRNCLRAIEAGLAATGDRPGGLAEREQQALVLLGDLASLAGDLEEANRNYARALGLPCEASARASIENRRHRPGFAFRSGARIAFYEHGAGPQTLLFVAPLAYGLATFQPLVERLCQEFRVVTVDSRGTGASAPLVRPYPLSEHVEDIRAVIAALGGGPVVGIGISRGANLLFKLAHAEPHLLEKLVTVGGPPGLPGPPFFSEDFLGAQRALLEKGDMEGVVRLHTALVLSEPQTRELRELFVRNRLRLPSETMRSFFDPDPTVDVTPILGEVGVPTLVVHGREDRLVALAASEYIAARLPKAAVYAFEGKGHLPLFTAPDEFCEVLRGFARTGRVPRTCPREPRAQESTA